MNGYVKRMPLVEARQLFWKARIGWLQPLDWVRVGHGSQARQGNGADLMQDRVARFAYKLLTRGSLALPVDDACLADEHGDFPSRGTVAAWAYRFASIFKGSRAIESGRFLGNGGIRELGYRIKPGIDWLLIVDVDAGSQVLGTAVDWRVFLTPPPAEDGTAPSLA